MLCLKLNKLGITYKIYKGMYLTCTFPYEIECFLVTLLHSSFRRSLWHIEGDTLFRTLEMGEVLHERRCRVILKV
jgi:hypothetical protein